MSRQQPGSILVEVSVVKLQQSLVDPGYSGVKGGELQSVKMTPQHQGLLIIGFICSVPIGFNLKFSSAEPTYVYMYSVLWANNKARPTCCSRQEFCICVLSFDRKSQDPVG